MRGMLRGLCRSEGARNRHASCRLEPDEDLARGITGTGQGIVRSRELIEPCGICYTPMQVNLPNESGVGLAQVQVFDHHDPA